MASLQIVLAAESALQAYLDNADYEANDSESQAVLAKAALQKLKVLRPALAQFGGSAGESIRFDWQALESAGKQIDKFLSGKRIADDPQIGYVNTEDYIC